MARPGRLLRKALTVMRHHRRSGGLVVMAAESRLKPGEDFLRDSCAILDRLKWASKLFAGGRERHPANNPVCATTRFGDGQCARAIRSP
jgi:hypothetical protein